MITIPSAHVKQPTMHASITRSCSLFALLAFVACFSTTGAANAQQSNTAVNGWLEETADFDIVYFFWTKDRSSGKQIVTMFVTTDDGTKDYFIDGFWTQLGENRREIKRTNGSSWVVDLNNTQESRFSGGAARSARAYAARAAMKYDAEYRQLMREKNMMHIDRSRAFGRILGQVVID